MTATTWCHFPSLHVLGAVGGLERDLGLDLVEDDAYVPARLRAEAGREGRRAGERRPFRRPTLLPCRGQVVDGLLGPAPHGWRVLRRVPGRLRRGELDVGLHVEEQPHPARAAVHESRRLADRLDVVVGQRRLPVLAARPDRPFGRSACRYRCSPAVPAAAAPCRAGRWRSPRPGCRRGVEGRERGRTATARRGWSTRGAPAPEGRPAPRRALGGVHGGHCPGRAVRPQRLAVTVARTGIEV
jgi:hypothetical protein